MAFVLAEHGSSMIHPITKSTSRTNKFVVARCDSGKPQVHMDLNRGHNPVVTGPEPTAVLAAVCEDMHQQ
jgi:hypothetical protein